MTSARTHRRILGAWALLSLVISMVASMMTTPPAAGAPGEGIDPNASPSLTIHKLEQPNDFGDPGSGQALDAASLAGMVPIPGVTFEVTKVPGIDFASELGRQQARGMSVNEAAGLVAGRAPDATGMTAADGSLVFSGLGVGVFVVTETSAPAGVLRSDPFVVTLPMPHPTDSTWLYDVHVYPKNARADTSMTVSDELAVSCGDDVSWTAGVGIPRVTSLGTFVVRNILSKKVSLKGSYDDVVVSLGGATLTEGTDYVVADLPAVEGAGFDVTMTEAGRGKLVAARAADSGARVSVTYRTIVDGPGEHINQAILFVDDAAPVKSSIMTKFGAMNVRVYERGNPTQGVAGTKFKIYANAEDAAAGRNWLVIGGRSEWEAGPDGVIYMPCLRFSAFIDGLEREATDPRHREYYVAPSEYPAGWNGDKTPLKGTVNSADEAEVLDFDAWQGSSSQPTTPHVTATPTQPGGMPATGARVAGTGLLAVSAIGIGIVLVRRRKDAS